MEEKMAEYTSIRIRKDLNEKNATNQNTKQLQKHQ